MRLPDGRLLGYAEYGDPTGSPLFSFHGGISSRLDAAVLDGPARRLGIRVIAPDRPGIGLSDRAPHRTLTSWPVDLERLATHLDLEAERFLVLGWAAGGAYAMACAAMLPTRVRAVALVASTIPIDAPGARAALDRSNRALITLARRAPWAARLMLRWLVQRPSPDRLLGSLIGELSAADTVALERLGPPERVTAPVREAMRNGPTGVVDDLRVLARPWGFDPASITAPTRIWQGSADTLVPAFYARWLGERIPDSMVRVVRGEGHVSLLHHRGFDILADLLTAAA